MDMRHIMLSAALLSAGALFSAGEMTPATKELIRNADLSRQEIVHRGDFLVREGHKLFEDGDFDAAIGKYMEAVKLFRRYPSKFFTDKIEFCQKEIAACYYAKANAAVIRSDKLALENDFSDAIKICEEALKYCPEQADELQKRIRLYEKRRDSIAKRSAVSTERLIPNKEAQAYQIQVLLEQARRLALAKDYSSALIKYNEVLLIDPYNADATQGRRGVARRIAQVGNERYVNTHRRTVAEVEWKYALPILPESSGTSENVVADKITKPEVIRTPIIQPKLEKIMIDQLDFKDIPISKIVNYLQEQSRKVDTDKNAATKGVNIIYIGDVRNADS